MDTISRKEALIRALNRYYTGKPCPFGHVCERRVASSGCVECERLKAAKFRHENPDIVIQRKQRFFNKNRERELQRFRLQNRARYVKNPRARLERNKQWKAKNKDKVRAIFNRWRRNHPDQVNAWNQTRRALKHLVKSTFTRNDWQLLLTRSPHCHWCKLPWTRKRRPTHDHIIPLSKGGENTLENSCCACLECNSGKGDRPFHPITGQGILL